MDRLRAACDVMDELELGLVTPAESWAAISGCGRYRYELGRRWGEGPLLEWAMLNPSVADADVDDPTIRRCIRFAKDWGFHGIRVTNLFAYRATNPNELAAADDPCGPLNHEYLGAERGPITVVAWGAHPIAKQANFESLGQRSCLMSLGVTKDGHPRHPLYVPASRGLSPWP